MALERLIQNLMKAEKLTTNKAMEKALFQSSGKYKRKQLAKMGHPYAERHGATTVVNGRTVRVNPTAPSIPYGDPARINVQTGKFYLNWKKDDPQLVGGSIVSGIHNPSPYARKLEEGIPNLTIPRPLIQRIIPVVQYWRERNIAKAIRDSLI